MMREALLNFNKQFEFSPRVQNASRLKKYQSYLVLGMGGSHLAADILRASDDKINIQVWSDYGLPTQIDKDCLVIAGSYSGNTAETIDGAKIALQRRLPVAVIATGGQLLSLARENNLPYVQLPDTGIQPRVALGFSLRALLALMKKNDLLRQTNFLAKELKPARLEKAGKKLAQKLHNQVPLIYASTRHQALAYNWKIKFNETGKIPAFYNVLPELNHNEMTGFDVVPATKNLSANFHIIILRDRQDDKRVQARMKLLYALYRRRGLPVTVVDLGRYDFWTKIFSSLLLADFTALSLAEHYGVEPEAVPIVEEFKQKLKE